MTHTAAHSLLEIGIAGVIVLVLALTTGWRNLLYVVPIFAVITVLVAGMGWLH